MARNGLLPRMPRRDLESAEFLQADIRLGTDRGTSPQGRPAGESSRWDIDDHVLEAGHGQGAGRPRRLNAGPGPKWDIAVESA